LNVKILGCALVLGLVALAAPSPALATPFGFSCVSSNTTDCAVLQTQLHLDVTLNAGSPTMVDFLFTNTGPAASSITDVYFDDAVPALLGLPGTITESSGVKFSAGCTPGNLPGGTLIGFSTDYCADSNSPVQPNGVNPGEWLRLTYTLQPNTTLAQVLAALDSGQYRVGIHVQGFADGGSVSGVAGPPPAPVPEPASLIMVGTGFMALARFARRQSRRVTRTRTSKTTPSLTVH
jgi:PEP-CTERM motif